MTNEPQPLSMGRIFPARDPVSQFVISLSIAINDLVVTDRHLHDAMDEGSDEAAFYFRLLCSYFHELGEFFKQARRAKPVKEFVASLADDAREDFRFICRFEGELAVIRHAAFHFPKIGSDRLARALEAVKDEPARVVHEERGRRMEFADHVAAYMSFGPVSDAEVVTLMRRISEAVTRIGRFGSVAMNTYAGRLGIVEKGPGTIDSPR